MLNKHPLTKVFLRWVVPMWQSVYSCPLCLRFIDDLRMHSLRFSAERTLRPVVDDTKGNGS